MDDGDILGLGSKPKEDASDVADLYRAEFSVSNSGLVQHCGGTLDLNLLGSNYDKKRYFLATRTVVSDEVVREKIENATGYAATDDTVMILSILAKSFIANKIETVRKRQERQGSSSSSPISVSDLLGANSKDPMDEWL